MRGHRSREVRGFAHRATRRKIQLHAAKGAKALTGEFRQIPRPGLHVAHGLAQNLPRLLFHGTMVLGRAYPQARLHFVIEVADRDARHGRASHHSNVQIYAMIAMQSKCRQLP